MARFTCPGQDSRNLKAALVPCPQCGYKVEIFSDELRRRCPACGAEVSKEQMPSCIQWCQAARSCIGETKWRELFRENPANGEVKGK